MDEKEFAIEDLKAATKTLTRCSEEMSETVELCRIVIIIHIIALGIVGVLI